MNEKQLIEKIHSEFDSAQDRLLSQAKLIIDSAIPNETPIETISERLKKVGFINTPTVKKGEEIMKVRKEKEIKVVESREQAELIQYYRTTYPFMKFLTEDELERICKKYGLTHSFVSNYIKEIPENNLSDIEKCQILKDEDYPQNVIYAKIDYHNHWMPGGFLSIWDKGFWSLPKIIKNKHFNGWSDADTHITKKFGVRNDVYIVNSIKNFTIDKQGLFICAPPSHFKNKSKFNISFTEVKDPIVFRYVRGGVQVITKWGLEANDPSLVVPVLN